MYYSNEYESERGRDPRRYRQHSGNDQRAGGRSFRSPYREENYGGRDEERRANYDDRERMDPRYPESPYGPEWSTEGYDSRDYGPVRYGAGDYGSRAWSKSQNFGDRGRSSWPGGFRGPFTGKGPKGYQRSDERIAEDINEALTQHPGIDASEIEVKVENGQVTLGGTVSERHYKRMAEDVADRCPGVRDVCNEIRIQREQSAVEQAR